MYKARNNRCNNSSLDALSISQLVIRASSGNDQFIFILLCSDPITVNPSLVNPSNIDERN